MLYTLEGWYITYYMIEILLATYNAAEYLLPQLQSIFAQTRQDFHLTIRDNCSTDDTCKILYDFAAKHPGKITIIEGEENLGAKGNFAYLIQKSRGDYVMFSDADDVWLPEKIASTRAEMLRLESTSSAKMPLLVHTDLKVVNRSLNILSESFWDYTQRSPETTDQLNRLLVQNTITGCTMMANRALLDLAQPIPKEAFMHDWWLGLVACAFGRVGMVKEPTMLYRQHGKNQIGAAKSLNKNVSELLEVRHRQASAFLDRFESRLRPEQKEVVEAYVSMRNSGWLERKKTLFRHKFFCKKFSHNIALLLLG